MNAPVPTNGVSVRGLGITYGPLRAVSDFSLEFPAGKCTVLLGPSGCGKTTVLRSIAGLTAPDSGRIQLGDLVAYDAESGVNLPPDRRHLGMVFQSYALWPHLTVADNVSYPLAGRGLSRRKMREHADAMLEWVGLTGLGERFPHELSGGQQQRVSLARAMVGEPRAVLFDEPLSNLDARLRERMRMELLGLRARARFASIYVTHDQLEAMTLGDQVVVMRSGRIEQVGSPEEVYKQPRTRFVADFMGIPNMIEGSVAAVDPSGGIVVDTVMGPLQTRGWRDGRPIGSRCTVAVRPTLIGSRADGPGVRGRVLRSVFQGTSTVHLIDLGGTTITSESHSEHRHPDGAEVSVRAQDGASFALLDD